MLISAFRYLRAAWSPPPYVSSLRTHHYHHHPHHHHLLHHPQHQQDSVDDTSSSSSSPSMETLLEPIRYSMAFLTLFSILSTVIIAIILVPFGPLQLLAQLISLVVSLSGLVGTFRRSIVLSSVYALSMLLFLFLQCSYFFVLLKLVQEVNGLTAVTSDSNFDKSFPYHTSSSFPYNSVSSSFDNTSPVRGFEHYPSPYTLPGENGQQNVRPAELSYQPSISSSSSFDDQLPPDQHSLTSASAYAYPRPRPMRPGRHISEMLNEELAYLSLLTVPMLAWLPPSLFMESVAVLLLTMQAIAGACFLYALRRSQAYYQQQQQQEQHQNYFAYSRGNSGANKLDIEHQASLLQALDPP